MNANFIFGVIFPVELLILGWLLRHSDGAWWRIVELPGVASGRNSDWSVVGVIRRADRIVLRLLVATGYLTATVSEVNDFVRLLGIRLRSSASRDDASRDAWQLLRSLWRRTSALVLIASCAAIADLGFALAMCLAGDVEGGLGHFATPVLMAVVIAGLSEFEGNTRTVNHRARRGIILWSFRLLGIVSLVAICVHSGWSGGSPAAFWLGRIGLSLATLGALAPLAHWWHDDYRGWKQYWTPSTILAGAMLGVVATLVELATFSTSLTPLTVISSLGGAATWVAASYVFAMLALDPPQAVEMDPATL